MKRTILLFAIIIIIASGWSAGWYFVAGKVESVIAEGKAKLVQRGQSFECDNQLIEGFPFRISIQCEQSSFNDAGTGFSIDAGAMRTASQVYQPGKAVVELDGPAVLHLPVGEAFDMNWSSLRSSVSMDLSGPSRFSVLGQAMDFKPRDDRYDSFNAKELQIHGRKVETNSVDLAVSSQDVVSLQNRWPAFDFSANIRVNDVYELLLRRPDLRRIARERGLDGQIAGLKYALDGGGEINITGPYSISTDGLLSGKFRLQAIELSRIAAALKTVMREDPELLQQITTAAQVLDQVASSNGVSVQVTVANGNARVGFIPLGRVPRLF